MRSMNLPIMTISAIAVFLIGLSVPATAQDTVDVSIVDFDFQPSNLMIEAGTTVRWTNNGSVSHTTTSLANPALWDSGIMGPGAVFTHTFTSGDIGVQNYFCELHPNSMQATLEVTVSTDVEDNPAPNLPDRIQTVSNYPNPFNPSTTIQYSLAEPAHVAVEIFNVLGQRVKTLVDDDKTSGEHRVDWDGTDSQGARVSSGTYLYRVTTGSDSKTSKMMLVR